MGYSRLKGLVLFLCYLLFAICYLLFAKRGSYLSSSVMTRITTSASRKLRSSHLGRSGPDRATQATTAKMRQINVQESIVQKGVVVSKAKSVPTRLVGHNLLPVRDLRASMPLSFGYKVATG